MDASSTTTRSQGSGLSRWCLKPMAPGMTPSSRCRVDASAGIPSRTAFGRSSEAVAPAMAACSLPAALPVGAARAMRRGRSAGCSRSSARIRATVVVLPVPGPPDMTQRRLITATAAATRCQSGRDGASAGKWRANPRRKAASSMAGSSAARRRSQSASSDS